MLQSVGGRNNTSVLDLTLNHYNVHALLDQEKHRDETIAPWQGPV